MKERIFTIVALLSLLAIKGGQGVIEKGTLIQNVMVANDYQIDESAH